MIAHGWNNDMAEARALYARAASASVGAVLAGTPPPAGRRIAVLGVLWPSKKFAERELIPGGGAAGLGAALDDMGDVATGHLEREIDILAAIAGARRTRTSSEAKALLDRLENEPAGAAASSSSSCATPRPAPTPAESGPRASPATP